MRLQCVDASCTRIRIFRSCRSIPWREFTAEVTDGSDKFVPEKKSSKLEVHAGLFLDTGRKGVGFDRRCGLCDGFGPRPRRWGVRYRVQEVVLRTELQAYFRT